MASSATVVPIIAQDEAVGPARTEATSDDDAAATEAETFDDVDDVIIVRGVRRRTSVDRRSYDISVGPDAGAITAREAIERLPGVITDIDGELSILGQTNVQYLVDGQFFPRELAMQIPASQIERVEIITNPGADAGGDGIRINLILAKEFGAPSALTLTGRADTRDRYKLSADYSYDDQDWRRLAFVRLESETVKETSDAALRYLLPEQEGQVGDRSTERITTEDSLLAYAVAGRKFEGGRQVSLALTANANRYAFDTQEALVRRLGDEVLLTQSEDSSFAPSSHGAGVSLGYAHEAGPDDKLVVNLNLFGSEGEKVRQERFVRNDLARPFERRADRTSATLRLTVQREKRSEGGDEAKFGLEASYAESEERYAGEEGGEAGGEALIGPAGAPDGVIGGAYERDVLSVDAYGSYAFTLGRTTFLPGLRVEALGVSLRADGRATDASPSYVRALPSLHVGRELGRAGMVSASIARKTIDPIYEAFDPVLRRTSFDGLSVGSPDIRIGTTTNYEASHELKRGKVTSLLTAYRRERRDGTDVFIDFLGEDLFLRRYVNIDEDWNTGASLNLKYRPGPRFEHALDVEFRRIERAWDVDERDFRRDLDTYNVKYNLEYKHDKKHAALLIVQQQGPGLYLTSRRSERLSSTLRYVRTFSGGAILTVEGIDLLATDTRTSRFETDALETFTTTRRQERGLRVSLSKRF